MRHLLHFEKKEQPLLPKSAYRARVMKNVLAGLLILAFFLGIGIWGYHATCAYSWIDSLLNASMILSGMGPIGEIPTYDGKMFASMYALVSGVVFITTIGIIIAPVVHRAFHLFHLDEDREL